VAVLVVSVGLRALRRSLGGLCGRAATRDSGMRCGARTMRERDCRRDGQADGGAEVQVVINRLRAIPTNPVARRALGGEQIGCVVIFSLIIH